MTKADFFKKLDTFETFGAVSYTLTVLHGKTAGGVFYVDIAVAVQTGPGWADLPARAVQRLYDKPSVDGPMPIRASRAFQRYERWLREYVEPTKVGKIERRDGLYFQRLRKEAAA